MKVAVICGGSSYERVVSLRSGAAVADAARELGHDVVVIDSSPATSDELKRGKFDVAVIALHGKGGEDGHVQGLLELLNIPYTGSRPGPSQCAYEKARAKRMLIAANVPTPDFVSLTATALQEFGAGDALTEASETLGFPVVVKAASGGPAMGVRIVRDEAELPRAIVHAMSYDGHVLVEGAITGRELAVCLLGTSPETIKVLPPIR
ncbi:MAG: ATP-grasp domain-containing protein, partial [Thermoleophilia bacterium]|nr:ATP-grasp domain-containing protein [Thermoleophilia bacterium]